VSSVVSIILDAGGQLVKLRQNSVLIVEPLKKQAQRSLCSGVWLFIPVGIDKVSGNEVNAQSKHGACGIDTANRKTCRALLECGLHLFGQVLWWRNSGSVLAAYMPVYLHNMVEANWYATRNCFVLILTIYFRAFENKDAHQATFSADG